MATRKPPKPQSKTKKPAKAKPRASAPRARAVRVAAQAAAGVPVREIAAELGLTRQTIYRELRSDDCRQIGITLANRQIVLISTIFNSALQAIAEALAADRPEQRDKKGNVTLGGPDHYARMTAVARLCKIMTLGRPTATATDERGPSSLLLPQETPVERSDTPENAGASPT